MLDLLVKSLEEAPVIKRGEYSYFIHPVSDGIPFVEPELMMEVCNAFTNILNLDADYILTVESMGIHLSFVLSQLTGLPVNVVRKKQYWLEGEQVLDQKTGYGKGSLYMNYVEKGDRVLIIDAVVSTGGTLNALLSSLKKMCVEVVDVGCVIGRGEGAEIVENKQGVGVKTLADIEVEDKVKVLKLVGEELSEDK